MRRVVTFVLFCLVVLSVQACALSPRTSHAATAKTKTRAKVYAGKQALPIVPGQYHEGSLAQACSGQIESVSGFTGGGVIYAYSPKSGFVGPAWAYPTLIPGYVPPPGSRPPGVYLINPSTSVVTQMVSFPHNVQSNGDAAGDGWVVWEKGTGAASDANWTLYAQRVGSHTARLIFSQPSGYFAVRDTVDLTINGDRVFWLSALQSRAGEQVTRVYEYNLATNTLTTVLQASSATGRLIVSIAVVGSDLIFSTANSGNPYNTSAPGSIMSFNLNTGRVLDLLDLQFSPTFVTATGRTLVFVFNSSGSPNSAANTAPYPLVVYHLGEDKVTQVTVPGDFPEFPEASGQFVTWWNVGQASTLLDLSDGDVFPIPGRSFVSGDLLAWGTGDGVSWCDLSR